LSRVDGGAADAIVGDIPTGPGFQALAPCNSAADYSSGSTVSFGGLLGTNFSPKCMLIHVGESVAFAGDFSMHPLRSSTRATTASPIQSTATGTSAQFSFLAAGYFPYFCGRGS
jgi:hypothetical protein